MERLAWVELLDRHGDVTQRHPVYGWPVHIGRGYDCDVVVDDAYVAPRHLRVEPLDGGRYRVDAGASINGLTLSRRSNRLTQAEVGDGDVLRIGHTQLRLRDVGHEVAAEKPLPSRSWSRSWGGLVIALAIFLVLELLTRWLDYNRDEAYAILVQPLFGLIPAFMLWIGIWALLGKVFSTRANMIAHSVTALFGASGLVLIDSAYTSYPGFAFNAERSLEPLSMVLIPLFFGAILYRHIRLVSRIGRRALVWLLGGLMACMMGLIHLNIALTEDERLMSMSYARTIGPVELLFTSGRTVDDFMGSAERLQTELQP